MLAILLAISLITLLAKMLDILLAISPQMLISSYLVDYIDSYNVSHLVKYIFSRNKSYIVNYLVIYIVS